MMVRQGDVLLVSMAPTTQMDPAPTGPRGLVLAEGESSGHFHVLTGAAKLFRFRDAAQLARIVVVDRDGGAVSVVGGGSDVARHAPIALAGGQYLSTVQRSWTAEDEARSRQMSD